MQEVNKKPVILWLADTPGWAYDSIVTQETKALPQYEHRCFYVCGGGLPNDGVVLARDMSEASIIIAMYVLYLRIIPPVYQAKTAVMLTGFRPFEREA